MSGYEEFKNIKTLHKVGFDRDLNDLAGRVFHKSAKRGQLFDLRLRTSGAGVQHNENGIEVGFLIFRITLFHLFDHHFFQSFIHRGPYIDYVL